MTDKDMLQEISAKLSILIALELKKDDTQGVQAHIPLLSRFGLSVSEIAGILGTTTGTVSVAKNRIKKRDK